MRSSYRGSVSAIVALLAAIAAPAAAGAVKTDKVSRMLRQLELGDREQRLKAAWVLGEMKDPRAVEPLIKVLGNKKYNIDREAVEALGLIGDKRAVDALKSRIKDARSGLSEPVAIALGRIGDPSGVDALIWGATDKDSRCERAAVASLVKIGPPAVPAMLAALKTAGYEPKVALSEALGKIGDKRAVEPLLPQAEEIKNPSREEFYIRAAAVSALAQLGDVRALPRLLKEFDTNSRRHVSDGLVKIGLPAVEPLIKMFTADNADPNMRPRIARVFGAIGDKRAVEPLLAAAKRTWGGRGACRALGRIGGPKAYDAIVDVLKSRDAHARAGAADGLGYLGDKRAVEPLITALSDEQPMVAAAAVAALAKLGDKRAVKPIIAAMRTNGVRGAVKALASMPDPASYDVFCEALRGRPGLLALPVAEALLALGEVRAVPQILAACKDSHRLKDAMPPVLAKFGPKAVPALILALKNDESYVCVAAAKTLGLMKARSAADALREATKVRDYQLLEAAVIALAAIGDPGAADAIVAAAGKDPNWNWDKIDAATVAIGPRAAKALTRLAKSNNYRSRWAIPVLGRIGGPEAAKGLSDAIGGGYSDIQVVDALTEIGPPAGDALAKLALEHSRSDVRQRASRALLILGYQPTDATGRATMMVGAGDIEGAAKLGPGAIPALVAALRHRDPKVRLRAAKALAGLKNPEAAAGLIKALDFNDRSLREALPDAIAQIGAPALKPLIEAMGDPSYSTRDAIEKIILKIGKPAVDPLLKTLKSDKDTVACQSAYLLGKLGDRRAVDPLLEMARGSNASRRLFAVGALADLGDPRAVPALVRVARTGGRDGMYAIQGLGKLGAPGVKALIGMLGYNDRRVRAAVTRAIEQAGPAAIDGLARHLDQAGPESLKRTADLLAKLAWKPDTPARKARFLVARELYDAAAAVGPEAVEPLLAAMKSGRRRQAEAAASALGKVRPAPMDTLTKLMVDKDESMRTRAARALGGVGGDKAVAVLAGALEDPSFRVRYAAGAVLIYLKWQPATDAEKVRLLAAALKWREVVAMGAAAVPELVALSKNKAGAYEAAQALAKIGGPAVPALIRNLSDAGPSVRASAAAALGQTGDPRAVKPLRPLLSEKDVIVAGAAAKALCMLKDAESAEAVLALAGRAADTLSHDVPRWLVQMGPAAAGACVKGLCNSDPGMRRGGGYVLLRIGPPAVAPLLEAARNQQSPVARATCAEVLGHIEDARAVKGLLAILGDADPRVRFAAAGALGRLGDASAVDAIIKTLEDANHRVRAQSVMALLALKDGRAVGPLIARLRDKSAVVRALAAGALGQLGARRAAGALAALLTDPDSRTRMTATDALDRIGWKPLNSFQKVRYLIASQSWQALVAEGPIAVDSLGRALKDADPNVRAGAARALGDIKDVRAVAPLLAAMKDADSGVQASAISGLGMLGDTRAVGPLAECLDRPDAEVRREAIAALIRIRAVQAVPHIIKAVEHSDPEVRLAAVDGLGAVKDPRATAALVDLLGSEDYSMRRRANLWIYKLRYHAAPALAAKLVDAKAPIDARIAAGGILRQLGWKPKTQRERICQYALTSYDDTPGPGGAEPLVALLGSLDPRARRAGANALARRKWKPDSDLNRARLLVAQGRYDLAVKLGDVAAEPLVMAVVTGGSGDTDELAAALARAGPVAMKLLAESMPRPSGYHRWDPGVVALLTKIGPPAAPAMVEILKNDRRGFSAQQVATALVRMGRPAVAPVTALLKDPRGYVREVAMQVLCSIAHPDSTPVMVRALSDPDLGRAAAETLKRMKWTPDDDEQRIRYLWALRDAEALKALWPAARKLFLADAAGDNAYVAEVAVEALTALGRDDETVVKELLDLLKTKGTRRLARSLLYADLPAFREAARKWLTEHPERRGPTSRSSRSRPTSRPFRSPDIPWPGLLRP